MTYGMPRRQNLLVVKSQKGFKVPLPQTLELLFGAPVDKLLAINPLKK
jgi:hypothetical protein